MVQTAAPLPAGRALERRREILRAASLAFRARGFHAAGMREIADALGMTVGNLYYYFASKQDLLAFCQEDTLHRLLQLVRWVRARELRADERLRLVVVGHVCTLNEATPGSLAHLEVEALPPAARRRILARRDRYQRALRDIVAEGTRARVFRAVDPQVAALALLGAVNWTVRWFRPEGPATPRAIGAQMAEHLVRGLLAPGVELRLSRLMVPCFAGLADPPEMEQP